MADTITVRTEDDTEHVLDVLTRDGTNRSEAIRHAVLEVALRRERLAEMRRAFLRRPMPMPDGVNLAQEVRNPGAVGAGGLSAPGLHPGHGPGPGDQRQLLLRAGGQVQPVAAGVLCERSDPDERLGFAGPPVNRRHRDRAVERQLTLLGPVRGQPVHPVGGVVQVHRQEPVLGADRLLQH